MTSCNRLTPGTGYASPRYIAANAVTAGCRPKNLPVIIAVDKSDQSQLEPLRLAWSPSSSKERQRLTLFVVNGAHREAVARIRLLMRAALETRAAVARDQS